MDIRSINNQNALQAVMNQQEVISQPNVKGVTRSDNDFSALMMQVENNHYLAEKNRVMNATEQQVYFNTQDIDALKYEKNTEKALMGVAQQFEAIFVQQILKQMRSASLVLADEDNPLSSKSYDTYQDMFDGQLSLNLTQNGGMGLAKMMYEQMKGHF